MWEAVELKGQKTKIVKKVVILQIDGTQSELQQLIVGIGNVGRSIGYEFLITNAEVQSIPKDELLKHLVKKEEKTS